MKRTVIAILGLCFLAGCATGTSVSGPTQETQVQATQVSPELFIGKWKFMITYDGNPHFYREATLEVTDKEANYTWEKAKNGRVDDKAGSVKGGYEVRGDTLHFVPEKRLSFKLRDGFIEIKDSQDMSPNLNARGKRVNQ